MRAEAHAHVETINEALALLRRSLDWDRALRRLDELNARVEDPTLWNDPKAAQDVMRERRRLDEAIGAARSIQSEMADTAELIEMAEAEGDEDMASEGTAALRQLAERAQKDKVKALLSGEADPNDTYVEINAGAGGTESQDWAEMLQRMYTRWAERQGYKVELIDYHAGEQAGIKSATLLVKGENAYGYAKVESGVHPARPHQPVRQFGAAAHELFERVGLSGDRRHDRYRDQRQRAAHRHLSRVGRRRAAYQHHRFGGAHHALADRDRRRLPESAIAAQEQGRGL
jgi:hypothetical protein